MVNIIIYTTEEKLLHKQGKLPNDNDYSGSGYYYWRLYKTPKRLELKDVIYFATKGFIRGYFEIIDIDDSNGYDIEFHSNSWKQIKKPIPIKSFQGFKYADKVEGLTCS